MQLVSYEEASLHRRSRTTTFHHRGLVRSALLLFSFVLVACSPPGEATVPLDESVSERAASTVIPGRFIVTVRDGFDPARVASDFGVRPDFTYRAALNGFAGSVAEAARAGLMADARVVRIEPDQTVHAWEATTQAEATWGLDRIDQRTLPLTDEYTYVASGAGVTVYILDTGIRTSHTDFGSRARAGTDVFLAASDPRYGEDCNGHGTHVAGTVGGTTYGVAKAVDLVSVRVLDCNGSGSWSGVIAGIDWVTTNAKKPAVANMSLGGGASSTVDAAVQASIASGVSYVVAAGNGNMGGKEQDACGYSPARVAEAITVGATTKSDSKTSWSNYGSCVDIFAPGAGITSAWIDGDAAIKTISGTSMAAPHVAGVAALYLQSAPTAEATTVKVTEAIIAASTKGIVTNSKTASNHLLYSFFSVVPPPTDPIVDPVEGTDPDPVEAPLVLSATWSKVKGILHVTLSWDAAAFSVTHVDVHRREPATTTNVTNSGRYVDMTGLKGGGTLHYRVCEADEATCSNEVVVAY
jgi:subtilisin family serine protease